MTLKRIQNEKDQREKADQGIATLCDSLTVRLVAIMRHLLEKKVVDDKEFTDTLAAASAEMAEAKQGELDRRLGLKTVDREAVAGDVVLVDYSGKIDDAAFPGGTAIRQMVKVGVGGFVDGFDTKMAGLKAGSDVVIDVAFPADYPEKAVAGKTAKFSVLCRAVKEEIKKTEPAA
jgi:FKBP-type peptidyl-prolyl cis-trans isomerase